MGETALREHLIYLLDGGGAHLDFETAVSGLPAEIRGITVPHVPHTAWRLVEHMRICQWDILQFSTNAEHVSPTFPAGYWPADDAPSHDEAWERSLSNFSADLVTLKELVRHESTDLFARIPHGEGQTILREVLLVADHNAYHLGQLVFLRRALGAWPDDPNALL